MGHKDLRSGQIVYIVVFCNISFSWLLTVDGFRFIFLCRVYRVMVKTKNFSVDEENCREPAKQQRMGKNRTRRKQVVLFIGAYIQMGLLLKFIHFQLCIQNKTLTLLVNSWITSNPNPH